MSNIIVRSYIYGVDDDEAIKIKQAIEEIVNQYEDSRVELSIMADRRSFLPRRRVIELSSK